MQMDERCNKDDCSEDVDGNDTGKASYNRWIGKSLEIDFNRLDLAHKGSIPR